MAKKILYFFLLFSLYLSAASIYESSLIGYWKFEDTSGSVIDSTGNKNGTVQGSVVRGVAGKFGNAFNFDSVGAYVDAGASSTISPVTIEAWVNLNRYDTPNIFKTIVQINTHYGSNWSDSAFYISNGYLNAYTAGTSATRIALNQWVHVAMVNDGSYIRFYINGQQDSNTCATSPVWQNGWSFIRLGGGYAGDGENFAGLLDDVAIYSRALSSTEIMQHATIGIEASYVPEPAGIFSMIIGVLSILILSRHRKN